MGKGEMIAEVLTKLGSTNLFPTARQKTHNFKNNKNNPLGFFKTPVANKQVHKSGEFYSFFAWWRKKVLCPGLSKIEMPARVEIRDFKNPYIKKKVPIVENVVIKQRNRPSRDVIN